MPVRSLVILETLLHAGFQRSGLENARQVAGFAVQWVAERGV